jgi:outer membrane protein
MNKIITFMLCACALFFTAGCHTLKAPSRVDTVWKVPEWEKTSKAGDPVWDSIREQELDNAGPLVLVELVDIALRNNPSTREAWEDARAAEMEKKQAESGWFPQVTASGNYTKDRKVATVRTADLNQRYYGGTAEATMLIFDFGGREAGVREAYQRVLEANFLFNQAVQDLILEVEEAYYEFYSAKSVLEAAQSDVRDRKVTFDAAKQKFDVGVTAKLDVLQAEADYYDALSSLEEAKGGVKTAQGSLAQVLGFAADTEFEVLDPSGTPPADVTEEDISRVIEEAMGMRPDIAAARASLRATEANTQTALAELWPKLNIGGTAGKTWDETFGDNESYTHYHEYTAYMKVDWDVFDGFDNYAKYKEALAREEAEKAKLKKAEIGASAAVWTRYYEYRTAVRKFKFSQAFLESTKASYDLALESYSAGLKSILDLLQAQSKLSEARSGLIEAEKDLFVARAELRHATGKIHLKPEGE